MKSVRIFELAVGLLVLSVVICFCIQLSYLTDTNIDLVLRGYLPSKAIIQGNGIYLSCGIIGATVMPHSLYLGSGMVKSRMRDMVQQGTTEVSTNVSPEVSIFNADRLRSTIKNLPTLRSRQGREIDFVTGLGYQSNLIDSNTVPLRSWSSIFLETSNSPPISVSQKASVNIIRRCMRYSMIEVALFLCSFALFTNSAILIVSGSALYNLQSAASADLFSINDLLSTSVSASAGRLFAVALLFSGISAGTVATMAGQMVSEGAMHWILAPWFRRLLTRSISIVPSIVIAGIVGKGGLTAALNGTQAALSVILPFVSAPLIYFTSCKRFMTHDGVDLRNNTYVALLGVLLWLIITSMNVALLVLLGLGKS